MSLSLHMLPPPHPLPTFVLHLIPQPKMKGRVEKESEREGEKKGRKSRGKDSHIAVRVEGSVLYFQLGYVTVDSVTKYNHGPQRKTLRDLNSAGI